MSPLSLAIRPIPPPPPPPTGCRARARSALATSYDRLRNAITLNRVQGLRSKNFRAFLYIL